MKFVVKWNENDVSHQSYTNRERIDFSVARAMNYLIDPDKKKRLDAKLCILCFYSGSTLAGQAFTEWNCRVCLKDQPMWPNTAHPRICDSCSKAHKLCVDCGADLYLRVRRANAVLLEDK